MGQINVEVKVMKCKNPILFTWWNKEEVCVDACLVTCQCQGYKLDHCQQLITTEEQQTMPSSTIHALGDMKWAEKFAKALEASELITIPNKELDVVLSDAPDEEPETDTPPKQVKRNGKKQEIKRGVKDLCLDKIIFDKTKSHVNNAAQVILEELMTHQSGEDDEAGKSQTSESLARRGRSGNSMENTAENSSEEAPVHPGNMKETSAKRKSAIVVRPESCQMDENLVLETSCIEESARICGLKEPDEGPGVLKISNVGQAHHESPLSPRTFAELQPMRSSLNTMHHANQPMKDIHSIQQLTDRKIDDSLNIGGHSVDESMQALSQRNISKSSIPQDSALDNGSASIGNDGNISIAGMTFTTLEPSASSLFRSEIFPSEQHQTTICANPVDVSVSSHMSFISSSDINLSDVSQATIPLTYTPHGQLSFEDQTIFDTLRGMIDSAAPKSNLNAVTMDTGITGERHTPNETPRMITIPHDKSKSLSSAMSSYLAHKDDEYKRKYQKYQNDPNSVFVLCECCGAALTNKSIKRHMESIHSKGDRVRAHQCDVCGKKFLYETNLKRHLFIHTGVRFKCSFCDKTYKQDWNRQVHEKTHLNPGPSATAVRKPLRRNAQLSNRSVDCKICGKTLKQQSMKLHMDSHNQKMSTCQICGKTVKSGSKYQHAKLHTNEKTHACSYCSAKFYFKSALVAHMRKHTKERPIPCRYCDRTFPRYEARTNHERIHTGERPYRCDICRKDWRDRPTYMQHMQKHHPGVPLMYKKKPNTQ